MKAVFIPTMTFGILVLLVALVSANPGMLPDHPGYPAAGKDPVTGMSLANDTGQTNAGGQEALAKSSRIGIEGVDNIVQDPSTQDRNNRNLTRKGAGQLPEVVGPVQGETAGINPGGITSIRVK